MELLVAGWLVAGWLVTAYIYMNTKFRLKTSRRFRYKVKYPIKISNNKNVPPAAIIFNDHKTTSICHQLGLV